MKWYKSIKKDKNNNIYELIKPVAVKVDPVLPSCKGYIKDTQDLVLLIDNHTIQLFPPYRWDGATMAPDFNKVILPSLFHDVLYDAIKSGYNLDYKVADAIFMALMKATNFNLKNTYYSAVRRFGEACRADMSTGNLTIINL